MASLSPIEKRQFEELLGMESGYVLDFTNQSFQEFFENSNVDIYDEKYALNGDSKAKRMRCFWKIETDDLVGKVLKELLSLWKHQNDGALENRTFGACNEVVARLVGGNIYNGDTITNFLEKDFGSLSFCELPIDDKLVQIIENRYDEACNCLKSESAPLSVIFLCGSMLEGILLGIALNRQPDFVNAPCSQRDKNGNPLPPSNWHLGNLIDTAYAIGLLGEDVKKFSHHLRDFRNYIHPQKQLKSGFNPDQDTAKICMQVLHAAIRDLSKDLSTR